MDKSESDIDIDKNNKKSMANKGKRKASKDSNAPPKQPFTGYVRYLNETRETLRLKHPNLSAVEVTKLLAEKWGQMSESEKQPFLQAAEIDKERYNKEITQYSTSNGKKIKDSDEQISSSNTEISKEEKTETRLKNYDIPIFTDEFLEHNKVIDGELKLIRKSNVDFEQQNSLLEKHVENMEQGVEKLKKEMISTKSKNVLLQSYLEKLRSVLASAYSNLNAGNIHGATLENIDRYMDNLHNLSSTHGHVINKAKDIMRKLDL